MWQNSKLKSWQNSKTRIVTKLKNSNCDKTQNSNCDKNQKLKLRQNSNSNCDNSKSQIMTKLKNFNCDKTQFMKNLYKSLLVRTIWHLNNGWDVLWAAFCDSGDVFSYHTNDKWFQWKTKMLCVMVHTWHVTCHMSIVINANSHSHRPSPCKLHHYVQ